MPFGGIKVWAWLAVAGIATGAGAWLYSTVKDAGVRECRAKVDADTADLNDQLERLEEKYRDLTRAYLAMLEKTTALQSELDDAAREDPDADRPAFGDGSVQRLNEIR